MSEALENAQADLRFQSVLARFFGIERTIRRNSKEMTGYEWRNNFYVFKVVDLTTAEPPTPNPDSQHRSLPDF